MAPSVYIKAALFTVLTLVAGLWVGLSLSHSDLSSASNEPADQAAETAAVASLHDQANEAPVVVPSQLFFDFDDDDDDHEYERYLRSVRDDDDEHEHERFERSFFH